MALARRLYQLQEIDIELQTKEEALKEINLQVGESELLLKTREKVLSEKEHLGDLKAKQKDAEWELADLEAKIAQSKDKLYGGRIKNPKELVNLEREIESLKSKLREKEDELLNIMAEVETHQEQVKLESATLMELEQKWQQEQKQLHQKQAEIQASLDELGKERQILIPQIDSAALNLYYEVRTGEIQAIAKVEQGRCQGCHITLPVSHWQKARSNVLVRCSSCGRILYLE